MTPADELRTAVTRLRDTRNCDGYNVDCDSRELLDMIRVLLRTREPLANWLAKLADFCDSVEDVHGRQPPADNLSIVDGLAMARAINATAAPGPVLGGQITDRLNLAQMLLGGQP
jgi:hypothetical protein